jgi:hypothetical protein
MAAQDILIVRPQENIIPDEHSERISHDKKLAEQYTENWQEHEKHSEVYAGRGR